MGDTIYICPSDKKHSCSWEGLMDDIYEHFQDEHEEFLLDMVNEFSIDIRENSENRLLFYETEFYLIQTKIVDNTLSICLRFLGPLHVAEKITYKLNLKTDEDELTAIVENGVYVVNLDTVKDNNISCVVDITCNSDNDNEAEEEIDKVIENNSQMFIRNYSKRKTTNTKEKRNRHQTLERKFSLDVESKKSQQVKRNYSLNNKLSAIDESTYADSMFKCTNCNNPMIPPIFLCENKHSVCSDCKNSKKDCSICNEKITENKNKDLEEKSRKHEHPCKYSPLGCGARLLYIDLRSHEKYCQHCEYTCHKDDCNFVGQLEKIKSHLKTVHASTKMYDVLFNSFEKNTEFFMANTSGVFYCKCYEEDGSLKWRVVSWGPADRSYFIDLDYKSSKPKDNVKIKLRQDGNTYFASRTLEEIKKGKLKNKKPILNIKVNM